MVIAKNADLIERYYHPDFVMYSDGMSQNFAEFTESHRGVYATDISYAIAYDDEAWVEADDRVAAGVDHDISPRRGADPTSRAQPHLRRGHDGSQLSIAAKEKSQMTEHKKADEARKGLIDSVKGKVKEVAGAVTGNDSLTAEGQLEQTQAKERKRPTASKPSPMLRRRRPRTDNRARVEGAQDRVAVKPDGRGGEISARPAT